MKKIWNSSKLYIAAFLIPCIILLTLRFYFFSGHGNPIIGVLQYSSIFTNGLASVFFLLYLRNTPQTTFQHTLLTCSQQLLFSISYGMTAYALVQESNLTLLLSYCLFPIVFLSFEYMVHKECYCYFILTLAIIFATNPNCGVFVFSFFLILTLFELGIKHKLNFSTFIHCLSCMLLAFFLAAFRFFPYFESVYFEFVPFNLSYLPDMILSRFLPGSIASIAFASHCGTDLYFGLFFLIPLCMFFANKQIHLSKRICYGCFTLFLVLTIYVSPLRDFFHMNIPVSGYSVPFSFLLVFWCLKLALESWEHFINQTDKRSFFTSIAVVFLWIAVSYIRYSNNVVSFVIPLTVMLFVLYTTLLWIFSKTKERRKLTSFFLFSLVLCELTTSAWLCTDITQFSSKRGLYPSYFWEKETESTANNASSKHSSSESAVSYFDEDLSNLLTQLDNLTDLSSDEYNQLCGTTLPNFFEKYNAHARKIGLENNLFTKEAVVFSWEESNQHQVVKQTDTLYNFLAYTNTLPSVHTISFQLTPKNNVTSKLCMYRR